MHRLDINCILYIPEKNTASNQVGSCILLRSSCHLVNPEIVGLGPHDAAMSSQKASEGCYPVVFVVKKAYHEGLLPPVLWFCESAACRFLERASMATRQILSRMLLCYNCDPILALFVSSLSFFVLRGWRLNHTIQPLSSNTEFDCLVMNFGKSLG